MFTSMDKAIVALIGAVIFFVNMIFGTDLNLPVDVINGIVAALTPLLVWLIPNKKAA